MCQVHFTFTVWFPQLSILTTCFTFFLFTLCQSTEQVEKNVPVLGDITSHCTLCSGRQAIEQRKTRMLYTSHSMIPKTTSAQEIRPCLMASFPRFVSQRRNKLGQAVDWRSLLARHRYSDWSPYTHEWLWQCWMEPQWTVTWTLLLGSRP